MTMMPGLSDDDGKLLIADTLRLFVGLHKRFSWADLAAATGDDERKLRSYVEHDPPAMPSPVLMRVFAALPPEAFGRVTRRMGFAAPMPLDSDHSSIRHALTVAAKFVAKGNEALEDGALSPKEDADLADAAASLVPVFQVVAGGKRS